MTLTVSLNAAGCHPAAWRQSPLPPLADARTLRTLARTAEAKGLDAILLGAEPGTLPFDPLPLLGALIAATDSIGLCAAWSIDFSEPYHVARVFATLDHLAHGRTGWMPLLRATDRLRPRIGREGAPDDPEAYCDRAAEFVDVTRKLWDSWQDSAWAMDKPSGMFVDPEKVTPIDYDGRYFKVRGPLNVPRPPQGNPVVLMVEPAEPALRRFVAETADVMLTDGPTPVASPANSGGPPPHVAAGPVPIGVRISRSPGSGDPPHLMAGPGPAIHDFLAPRILQNLLVILADTEAAARARAAELDAMAPCDRPRFAGTPAGLAALIADSPNDGFNLMPAVLPFDLDMLPARPATSASSLRERFGLPRPLSQYEKAARA